MELVIVGCLVLGCSMVAWAVEIIPIARKFWRKRYAVRRTGPHVVTKIQVRRESENTNDVL